MGAEKNFENRIKRYLESNGIYALGTPKQKMLLKPIGYYEKRWGGGTFTKAGLPDLHIVINGRSLDVELKAENGKPTELQLFMIDQINNCGGRATLLYPKDFNIFELIVEGMMKK